MSDPQKQPLIAERNLADALADLLPEAKIVHSQNGATQFADEVLHVAVPKTMQVHRIDSADLLPNPRQMKGASKHDTAQSFVDYIKRHQTPATVVWCSFNPQTFSLSFIGTLDDHAPGVPGWRTHAAHYTPNLSAEWKTWRAQDEKPHSQVEFAAFLERNADDINADDGFPSSLDMLKMATEFEANGEKRVKSIVRLQGGGMNLTYVDDNDEATITQMRAFEKFQVGVPVFFEGLGYRMQARLRYRQNNGVKFWYELIRPDRVHETASRSLIATIREGIGEVPMMMGSFGSRAD